MKLKKAHVTIKNGTQLETHTAQSFLVLLTASFKFSRVSWWYSGSPHEKSNLATTKIQNAHNNKYEKETNKI